MDICTTIPPVGEAELPNTWIKSSYSAFKENFERNSFEVTHKLARHPLLQLPQLLELADRSLKTRPSDLYFDMGDVVPGQKWKDTNREFSPLSALRQLEESNAWFIFRSAQKDPAYTASCSVRRSRRSSGWSATASKRRFLSRTSSFSRPRRNG
ncbi:hypothetical protein [Paraburkholderia tropica]|uniref:hypothetical protein n=1 Tax=Paraburkholderia tropica TaxID=92647 RepID=UPI002389DA71|nr:hypothetical protein [Paraburkholderia tropica]